MFSINKFDYYIYIYIAQFNQVSVWFIINNNIKTFSKLISRGKNPGGVSFITIFPRWKEITLIKFQGIESNSASFLLSIIGITNTVGRVACGYVADFPQVDSLLLNNICLIISTVAVAATPFCHTYAAYIAMSIFFGIAICE